MLAQLFGKKGHAPAAAVAQATATPVAGRAETLLRQLEWSGASAGSTGCCRATTAR